jgi:hypothetical protein
MQSITIHFRREVQMKIKPAILTLFALSFLLTLTSCAAFGSRANRVPVPLPTVPVEGVHTLTASGYIEINAMRFSPHEPRAFFNPWPDYFALFPFAMTGGIPGFNLTNDVEEIFALLGIDGDDLAEDRFGNQKIENVSATFGNFEQVRITIGFNPAEYFYGTVSAALLHPSPPGENEWNIAHTDFLLVTDTAQQKIPHLWRAGEEFMGLRLLHVDWSKMYLKNGVPYRHILADATVEGRVLLKGEFSAGFYHDSDWRIRAYFRLSGESLAVLPAIVNFFDIPDVLNVNNSYAMLQALGINEADLPRGESLVFENITAYFDMSYLTTRAYAGYFVELAGDGV